MSNWLALCLSQSVRIGFPQSKFVRSWPDPSRSTTQSRPALLAKLFLVPLGCPGESSIGASVGIVEQGDESNTISLAQDRDIRLLNDGTHCRTRVLTAKSLTDWPRDAAACSMTSLRSDESRKSSRASLGPVAIIRPLIAQTDSIEPVSTLSYPSVRQIATRTSRRVEQNGRRGTRHPGTARVLSLRLAKSHLSSFRVEGGGRTIYGSLSSGERRCTNRRVR